MNNFTHSLGFIFNPDMSQVILITKQRPVWQKGLLNGLGGKLESPETILTCMVREAEEESGLHISANHWHGVAQLDSPAWKVKVYTTRFSSTPTTLHSATGETVAWYSTKSLPANCMKNLYWLIPLSQEVLEQNTPKTVKVRY